MDQKYVYIRSEPGLWTVGFYGPGDRWEPESDHGSTEEAAARVSWLNGGSRPGELEELRKRVAALEEAARATYDKVASLGGGY